MNAANAAQQDRFCPPAPYPVDGQRTGLLHGLRTFRSQIEGLPADVFEADAWRPPLPGMPLFVMQPDAIRRILLTEADRFPFGALFERIMRPVWGQGLLLSKGPAWRAQRHAAAQAFRAGDMAGLAPWFVKAANAALARWQALPDRRIDLLDEMKRVTFDIIIDTMLSGADSFDHAAIQTRIKALFADVSRIRPSYILRQDAYHDGRPAATSVHKPEIMDHIGALISVRRNAPPRGDLVDLLLAAHDPDTGKGFSDAQLADNLLGFIMAGHETTAVALTWTLYLVASHAPTRARLLAEAEAVTAGEPVAAHHLPQLVFARQVVSESMRLYPPAFMLTRVSARDTEIAGFAVKAGQRVNIPIYAIHRRAAVWPDPHAFDPDRFAPGQPAPDKFAYLPFGGGPRICIGAAFAMAEIVTLLVTLVRAAGIEPPPEGVVWPQTGLALYPRNGMPVTIIARQT